MLLGSPALLTRNHRLTLRDNSTLDNQIKRKSEMPIDLNASSRLQRVAITFTTPVNDGGNAVAKAKLMFIAAAKADPRGSWVGSSVWQDHGEAARGGVKTTIELLNVTGAAVNVVEAALGNAHAYITNVERDIDKTDLPK
jgi:hypothetical protein